MTMTLLAHADHGPVQRVQRSEQRGRTVGRVVVHPNTSRSFEEEFLECSYGYRPGRSVDRAIARIRKCRELGYIFVMDGDVQSFFDRVDHSLLLARLAERQPGEELMHLLRLWVSAHVWDGSHIRPLRLGVPQGSPISPLLANFFLEDFDRELEKSGRKLIRYGDDFLILAKTQGDAQAARWPRFTPFGGGRSWVVKEFAGRAGSAGQQGMGGRFVPPPIFSGRPLREQSPRGSPEPGWLLRAQKARRYGAPGGTTPTSRATPGADTGK
jgi:hypothetical protein